MRTSHRFARVIMNGTDKNKLLSRSVASGCKHSATDRE